jgi:hypothetical protein
MFRRSFAAVATSREAAANGCLSEMILAMALIIAATTWAFSPNPAAPIPRSKVI